MLSNPKTCIVFNGLKLFCSFLEKICTLIMTIDLLKEKTFIGGIV